MMLASLAVSVFLAAAAAPSLATSPQEPAPSAPVEEVRLVPERWLVLDAVDRRGRRPFRPDAVFVRHMLERGAPPPKLGDEVEGETGTAKWGERNTNENGAIEGGRFGWGYARLEVPERGVWLARIGRAATLWVNGTPTMGDYYGYGFGGVPVLLEEGANELYLTGVRGSAQLVLTRPESELFVAGFDATVPDLVPGVTDASLLASVLVVNASERWVRELDVLCGGEDGFQRVRVANPQGIPPLGIRKTTLRILRDAGELERDANGNATVSYRIEDRERGNAFEGVLPIRVRGPRERQRRTFVSRMDSGVQEFGVVPPSAPEDSEGAPEELGLVLSLHGASVGCMNQVGAYSAKPDFVTVAPTNRRPFGFDWQDWGRRDAYEVLSEALDAFGVAADRVYLTGHSMGGHGTWHLAANDPDRFAAIAPSAGWSSFDSYGGRPKGALTELWHGADGASNTLALIDNLAQLPTFVLHGDADDNVPASEARLMIEALEAVGATPARHFHEGAGHWWDGPAAAGADCVDWPGIFELFRSVTRPEAPSSIEFVTVDPGVDAEHHWVRVEQLVRYGKRARVSGTWVEDERVARLTTENVRRLVVSPRISRMPETVEVDGQSFEPLDAGTALVLERAGSAQEGWQRTEPLQTFPAPRVKYPARTGPFKRAFDQAFLQVVGTAGEPNEDRELLDRARHDAGEWWYRGNGSAWILTDVEFLRRSEQGQLAGNNVILYGNRDTNAAWSAALGDDCPISARRGRLSIGEQAFEGDDIGCAFVWPRAGMMSSGLVGVFADTGPRGSRLGATLSTFVSGVGFPDYAAYSSVVLTEGDGGVIDAGWFDANWRLVD